MLSETTVSMYDFPCIMVVESDIKSNNSQKKEEKEGEDGNKMIK